MSASVRKRVLVCLCTTLFLLLLTGVRLLVIMTDPSVAAAAKEQSLAVGIGSGRGQFYDCNGVALTGQTSRNVVVAAPGERVNAYVAGLLIGQQKEQVLATLSRGKPAVFESDTVPECPGMINVSVPVRYTAGVCPQLIGYVDETGHGVCGLERELDEVLYGEKQVVVRYDCDGAGRVIAADEAVVTPGTKIGSDVRLSIDANMQQVCRQTLEKAGASAAVIRQVGTGRIKAMVSLPDYDAGNVAAALDSKDSPLVNRCLMGYSVGSVFKSVVAAAGLEQGFTAHTTYTCTGQVGVENHLFHCHKLSGHGSLTMSEAVAYSCNAYFYQFSRDVGAKAVWEKASEFGFGNGVRLFGSLCSAGESLPSLKELQDGPAALANLSIGQGSLMASPLTISGVYEAIANKGVYHKPTVVEGLQKQGVLQETYDAGEAVRGCSEAVAGQLRSMLIRAVREGTATKANPYSVGVAGKTATAQTGWVKADGSAVEHGWFCGFFPAEDPAFVVCVMVEDVNASPASPSELFARIVDGISGLDF